MVLDVEAEVAGKEHVEGEALILESHVEAQRKVGVGVADDAAVVLVDHAVAVEVAVDKAAGGCAGLRGMAGHLLIVLENAVAHISVIHAHGLSGNEALVAADIFLSRVERDEFVLILREVERGVPGEVAVSRASVAQRHFPALVLHFARVEPYRGVLACHGKCGRNGEHVLGSLDVVVG